MDRLQLYSSHNNMARLKLGAGALLSLASALGLAFPLLWLWLTSSQIATKINLFVKLWEVEIDSFGPVRHLGTSPIHSLLFKVLCLLFSAAVLQG